MLYVHIVTGGNPRSHGVCLYRNWWRSMDAMLSVYTETGGRLWMICCTETGGHPQMSWCTSIYSRNWWKFTVTC